MEAARKAGAKAEELTEGRTSSWESILEDENFAHLPINPADDPIRTQQQGAIPRGGICKVEQQRIKEACHCPAGQNKKSKE